MIDERCASPLLAHTLTIKDQLRFVSAAPLRSKMSNGINELLSRRRYHFFVFLIFDGLINTLPSIRKIRSKHPSIRDDGRVAYNN